jgi:6-phosphogluconolactonase
MSCSKGTTVAGTTTENRRAIRVAENGEALAQAAASIFLATAMATRPGEEFTVALSGGSTPKRMYEVLSASPLAGAIPWSRVRLFFGDERCVAPDHADSNYHTANVGLFSKVSAIEASRIHRMVGEKGAEAGAAEYETVVNQYVKARQDGVPSFDLIFLGMGDDGHTASLFPGTAAVREEKRLVTNGFNKNLNSPRITFTPRLLNAARLVVFLVGGGSKASVLKKVLEVEGPVDEHPSRSVRPTGGGVLWLLDKDSAKDLSPEIRG